MSLKYLIILIFTLLSPVSNAQEFASSAFELSKNIIQLNEWTTQKLILVEKSTKTLFLFSNKKGKPELVKTYKIGIGKIQGNKQNSGDHKTPEGIYRVQDYLSDANLIKMYGKEQAKQYGAGAFILNYPNIFDQREAKSGSGIWIHSTDDDSRIDQGNVSRGCVVLDSKNFSDFTPKIENTFPTVVIVDQLEFLRKETWEYQKKQILQTVESWRKAWSEENLESYMSHYDERLFKDQTRGNFQSYKNYKRSVFSASGTPEIDFKNISAIALNDTAVVSMEQDYKSNSINDQGLKTVYLKRNSNYEWKILAETWEKLPVKTTQVTAY